MNAKEYLESQGIFGMDTKNRFNEVIEWMEGYALCAIAYMPCCSKCFIY